MHRAPKTPCLLQKVYSSQQQEVLIMLPDNIWQIYETPSLPDIAGSEHHTLYDNSFAAMTALTG